jgi:hypothetical protein
MGKAYSGGRFALELEDGSGQAVSIGFVTGIDGGHFKSDPVKSQVGADGVMRAYGGKPKFEDITLTIGMATAQNIWDWIQASLDNNPERRSGAIVGYDQRNKERNRREFYDALITEVGFPAMDGSSKASATMTLKISPEVVKWIDGDESSLSASWAQDELKKQKMWLTSNFRFSLDKFNGDPSLRNAKVDAFTVKQGIMTSPVGNSLVTFKEPGKIELPTLSINFATAHVDAWMQWWDATINGNTIETTNGALSYYASDGENTELMRIEFSEVTLLSVEFEKFEGMKEGISRVKATLHFQDMQLVSGDGNT